MQRLEYNVNVSSALFYLSSVVLVLFTINYCWKRRRLYYYSSKLKGPLALPFLGSIHEFAGGIDSAYPKSMEIARKYGPIGKLWLGSHLFIVVTEPEDVEYVMKQCLSKGYIYEFLKPPFGHGILTAPLSRWKTHRKTINQTFNQSILNSYFDIFVKRSNELMAELKKHYVKCETNIFQRFSESTFRMICDTCMGVDSADLNVQNEYMLRVAEGAIYIGSRFFNPLYHFEFLWNIFGYKKQLNDVVTYGFGHIRKILEKKKQLIKEQKADSSNNKNFLSYLLKVTEEEGIWTDKEMMEETQTMVCAGSDTTALTMSFATIMLALHQDIQQKLYKEVYDIFGDSDRDATLDDLTRMEYTERVIRETMRLFPVGPCQFREVLEDIKIRDVVIPEGSQLLIPVHFIHRNPKYWPDPLKFNPDRFLPEEVEKRPRYSYMPFSIPPRNCIGKTFAMMSMKVSLTNMMRNFRIVSTQHKSIETMKLHINVLISSANGYGVTLESRKK